MNKLTLKGNKISYCFTLYVADPATFLASNSVLGPYFSSENSLFFFTHGKKYIFQSLYYLYCEYYISDFEGFF